MQLLLLKNLQIRTCWGSGKPKCPQSRWLNCFWCSWNFKYYILHAFTFYVHQPSPFFSCSTFCKQWRIKSVKMFTSWICWQHLLHTILGNLKKNAMKTDQLQVVFNVSITQCKCPDCKTAVERCRSHAATHDKTPTTPWALSSCSGTRTGHRRADSKESRIDILIEGGWCTNTPEKERQRISTQKCFMPFPRGFDEPTECP